jgi:hypothetical protein
MVSDSLATPDHELRLALAASWRLILGVTYVLVLHRQPLVSCQFEVPLGWHCASVVGVRISSSGCHNGNGIGRSGATGTPLLFPEKEARTLAPGCEDFNLGPSL